MLNNWGYKYWVLFYQIRLITCIQFTQVKAPQGEAATLLGGKRPSKLRMSS